jgi:hypothetical protein
MGNGGIAPPFLTSTLGGGEWSASCPGPGQRAPSTDLLGGCGGPRVGLEAVEKRKKFLKLYGKKVKGKVVPVFN